jgi:hypothetical protein
MPVDPRKTSTEWPAHGRDPRLSPLSAEARRPAASAHLDSLTIGFGDVWLVSSSTATLFFIELENRRVHLAGCTTNPTGAWVTQQARNLSFTGLFDRMRFLIHDRDSKFSRAFDEVFRSEGITVIETRIHA